MELELQNQIGQISGILNDGKCPKDLSHNIQNFCDVGLKISGSTPLKTKSSLVLNNSLVTSVKATSTGVHSVSFMGTSKGSIKKVSSCHISNWLDCCSL